MCEHCDAFLESRAVDGAASYAALVERARAALADEVLEQVDGAALAATPPGPGVHHRHAFACTRCAQLFILELGTCHALGDGWRPLNGN